MPFYDRSISPDISSTSFAWLDQRTEEEEDETKNKWVEGGQRGQWCGRFLMKVARVGLEESVEWSLTRRREARSKSQVNFAISDQFQPQFDVNLAINVAKTH